MSAKDLSAPYSAFDPLRVRSQLGQTRIVLLTMTILMSQRGHCILVPSQKPLHLLDGRLLRWALEMLQVVQASAGLLDVLRMAAELLFQRSSVRTRRPPLVMTINPSTMFAGGVRADHRRHRKSCVKSALSMTSMSARVRLRSFMSPPGLSNRHLVKLCLMPHNNGIGGAGKRARFPYWGINAACSAYSVIHFSASVHHL